MTHLTTMDVTPAGRGATTATRPRVICAVSSLDRDRCADALRSAGFVVTAMAGDCRETMELAVHYRPDLLLVDAIGNHPAAIALAETVTRRLPHIHVALVGAEPEPHLEMRAVLSGACAYVSASWDDEMMRTLRAVAQGEVSTSPTVTGMLIERMRTIPAAGHGVRPIHSPLTNREWEVLDRLSAGLSPTAVAEEMDVATDTVQSHLKRLCRKLDVRSYADAVARADRLIVQAAA
jgi:two-component system nitrate/nitrite response regulator NarL